MSQSVRHFDDKRARVYDSLIRQVVPGYEVLHRMTALILRRELGPDADLLAVGAGTGEEIAHLAAVAPGWRITGVEPAAPMAEAASARIRQAGLDGRCQVVQGYCDDLAAEPLFDAAVMALVMHFVPDDGSKEALLGAVARRLKPGAPLILADLHAEVDGPRFTRFLDLWRDWQLDAGMTPERVEKGFRQVVTDIHFVPEGRILDLLHGAGFTTVEPFYGAYLFGAWIAWRAE